MGRWGHVTAALIVAVCSACAELETSSRAELPPTTLETTPATTGTTITSTTAAATTSTTTSTTTTSTTTTTTSTTVAATTTTGLPRAPMTSCTSVVHIGDSTSVGLISPSYLPDPATRVDAHYRRVGVTDPRMEISGARSTLETLDGQVNARDVAAGLKAAGYEGCWVLALGTTDTANVAVAGGGPGRLARIDRMMEVIGDDPVLWVNVKTLIGSGAWSNDNMQLWNQALVEATSRYANLRLFDWAAVVDDTWFARDEIHFTSDGYLQRGRLIADALAAEFPAAAST